MSGHSPSVRATGATVDLRLSPGGDLELVHYRRLSVTMTLTTRGPGTVVQRISGRLMLDAPAAVQ